MGWAYAKSAANHPKVAKEDLLLFEKYAPRAQEIEKENIGVVKSDFDESLSTADIIILAVKPQSFASLGIDTFITDEQLVVSIMAGVKIDLIATATGASKITRAMPNTPCQLGEGITGFFSNENTSLSEKETVRSLLAMTGKAIEVKNEDEIDAVTAVSGSGPAYFYYFIQSMVKAGVKAGLSEETSATLAKETMKGAYHLLEAQKEKSFDDMIAAVKSKGGTTEAALNIFADNKLDEIIVKALTRAKERANELSQAIEL